jgi:hypothetical protein
MKKLALRFCVPFAFIVAEKQSVTAPWKYSGLFKYVFVFVIPVFRTKRGVATAKKHEKNLT